MNKTYLILLVGILVLSCTSDEVFENDTTPPQKPDLVPHLGDVGFNELGELNEAEYNGIDYVLTEDNNGIDAVPYNNFIKINWLSLINKDIDYLNIYRSNQQVMNPVRIDSISINYNQQNLIYVDESLIHYDGLGGIFNNTWYYKIEAVDTSGNRTISDPVSYSLLEKAQPQEPSYFDTVTDDFEFVWENVPNVSSVTNNILVFDEEDNLRWEGIELTPSEVDTLQFDGNLEPGTYYWRVDCTNPSTNSGSESEMIEFYLQ